MMFQPCFLAVVMRLRKIAKSSAPCWDLNPPDIFWRNFIIRKSRSASLFVKGTSGSARNRKVPSLCSRSRNAKLCPVLRFLRPRFPGLGREGIVKLLAPRRNRGHPSVLSRL